MVSDCPFDLIQREDLERPWSRKWSLHPGTIGAWVAEMDFGTAPEVTEALTGAVTDGILGYLSPSTAADMGQATADWMLREYGWSVDAERVHPVSDVMSALAVAIERYTPEGSAVIVPTPAYMPFLSFLPTIGREVIQVPGIVENGRWRHDLEAIDAAFSRAHTLVLCNPHNPTGSVATRDELLALAEIVERHGGRVFSDEIHAPLTFESEHVPYASVSEAAAAHTITATSASKAWNIPGLKAAQLITSNDADEATYQRFGFSVLHGASTLGVIASTAAYRADRQWLDSTISYLDRNRRRLSELVTQHLPGARYRMPEATYIGWLDVSELDLGSPAQFFRERAGVTLTDGALCGTGFEQYVRVVFATPWHILEEAVASMGAAVGQREGVLQ